jgi:signal transduction histidine kinase
MHWSLYPRLVILTAGTLLPFYWMVVILGHRRQRNFERIFFFLCLALTFFFGCSLLALNARLFYGVPPAGLLRFAWTFLCLGLFFVPPLVLQLHTEYASLRELLKTSSQKHFWQALTWLPAIALVPKLWGALQNAAIPNFELPTRPIGLAFQAWLVLAMSGAAVWQYEFQVSAHDTEQKAFHRDMVRILAILSVLLALVFWQQERYSFATASGFDLIALFVALVPLALLVLNAKRFNFLQMGRQRNLMYAVFIVFLTLLYLSFVRRAGQWLEPYLPPESTAALLLFLPVVFFEPLQRMIRRLLRQTAQSEVDRAQKLMGPINDAARLGDLEKLRKFAEDWIAEQLQLAEVHLLLETSDQLVPSAEVRRSGLQEAFEIHRGDRHLGTLTVRPYGAMISGETLAALEFLCEQLPAALDLCRLIEEKLQLERELAERERLALIGQMAASISHNLKNPLGSIKTILQVQLESADLPASLSRETQMVLDEINRLSAKLNQLLQFSRPGATSGKNGNHCDLASVARAIVEMLRHEAEPAGIVLEYTAVDSRCEVAASAEEANDILSNVLLNGIEAVGHGGKVRLELHCDGQTCTAVVEDNGPGIPPGLKDKVAQPFFTTKARGTGLGLAIVARRLEELGGSLAWQSPVQKGRGTRFQLSFPVKQPVAHGTVKR